MPTLVLLPGMDGTGDLFRPFLSALGDCVTPFTVAYPPDERLSYEELEALVRRRLPGADPFVLLAESFSGPLAVRIAAQKPAGLRGVILCASFARSPAPAYFQFFAKSFLVRLVLLPFPLRSFLMNGGGPSVPAPEVLEAIRSVRPDVLAHRLKEALRIDVVDSLRSCRVPAAYVLATRDRLLGDRSLKRIAAAKPDIERILIDGPHLLLQCRPHEVARAIRPLLLRWSAGRPSAQ